MNKRQIINKIREIEGLTKEEKNYLVDIVNDNKQYGLVWENKPEKVEEYLETKLILSILTHLTIQEIKTLHIMISLLIKKIPISIVSGFLL